MFLDISWHINGLTLLHPCKYSVANLLNIAALASIPVRFIQQNKMATRLKKIVKHFNPIKAKTFRFVISETVWINRLNTVPNRTYSTR